MQLPEELNIHINIQRERKFYIMAICSNKLKREREREQQTNLFVNMDVMK